MAHTQFYIHFFKIFNEALPNVLMDQEVLT